MTPPLDAFTRQYIATALWTSLDDQDEPLDDNYGLDDFSPAALVAMVRDCARFQELAGDLIADENLLRAPDHDTEGTFGIDFWFTRNGHGVGFWDGSYAEPAATHLTRIAKQFGETSLYVGEDGKVHAE